jgi:hypothetical protein
MRFESEMTGLRASWRGYQRAGRSDKAVGPAEFGIGTAEMTHEEILDMPLGWMRAEGIRWRKRKDSDRLRKRGMIGNESASTCQVWWASGGERSLI